MRSGTFFWNLLSRNLVLCLQSNLHIIGPGRHAAFSTNKSDTKRLVDSKTQTKRSDKETRQLNEPRESEENDARGLFDPRYLAEVYQEFYRELAKAYTGLMNGFKKYK